jgi:hypothetical protein
MSDPTPTTPTVPSTATTPWYKSDLFRLVAGVALGFLVQFLAGHGITPAPLPTLPATPSVLVLNVSPTPTPAGYGPAAK